MTKSLLETLRAIRLISIDESEDTRGNPAIDYSEDGTIFDPSDIDVSDIDGIKVDQEQDDDGYNDSEVDGEQDDDDSGDPNRQGLIRTVPNAHLVYKRQQPDGTYNELWVYNVPDLKTELKIRQAILSGTDIPVNQTQSDTGKQTYRVWSIGNGELLSITGLPN